MKRGAGFSSYISVFLFWASFLIARGTLASNLNCNGAIRLIERSASFSEAIKHYQENAPKFQNEISLFMLKIIEEKVTSGDWKISEVERVTFESLYSGIKEKVLEEHQTQDEFSLRQFKGAAERLDQLRKTFLSSGGTSFSARQRLLEYIFQLSYLQNHTDRTMDRSEFKQLKKALEAIARERRCDAEVRVTAARIIYVLEKQNPDPAMQQPIHQNNRAAARLLETLDTIIEALVNRDLFKKSYLADAYDYIRKLKNPVSIVKVLPILREIADFSALEPQEEAQLQIVMTDLLHSLHDALKGPDLFPMIMAQNVLARQDPLERNLLAIPRLISYLKTAIERKNLKFAVRVLLRMGKTFDPEHENDLLEALVRARKWAEAEPESRGEARFYVIVLTELVYKEHVRFVADEKFATEFVLSVAPDSEEARAAYERIETLEDDFNRFESYLGN